MSGVDPLELLAGLDGPIAPRAAFADALLARCLSELEPRRRWRSMPRTRSGRVVAVLAAFLILAAVATATYIALRRHAALPRPAELTLIKLTSGRITGSHPGLATIQAVDNGGRLRTVWQCPERTWCGDLTSMAWSPTGRRLALTLDEIGGRSGYVGLHVIDADTGFDRHLGVPAIAHSEREQPTSVLNRLGRASTRALGCPLPHEVTWAPDGKRLAYVCGDGLLQGGARTTLYLINTDGTRRRRIHTGTLAAYWPSFSPDGTRIAFATEPSPQLSYRRETTKPIRHFRSSVYWVSLDGSRRALVARDASAPAWSPDGNTIAFESSCGVRLATPSGVDRTPHQRAAGCLAPAGGRRPAWSPDGLRIAELGADGLSIIRADGTGLQRLTASTSIGTLGVGRPAWRPGAVQAPIRARRPIAGL
jgi:dipeptidyl aminopeptidase/acylaminoacyl peptidase